MQKQQGAAVFLLLLSVFITLSSIALSHLSVNSVKLKRDQINIKVLTEARQGLLDYKNSKIPPVSLPCPDTDEDGLENGGCSGGAGGVLPWKTLQLNKLTDSEGLPIQYQQSSTPAATAIVRITLKGTYTTDGIPLKYEKTIP